MKHANFLSEPNTEELAKLVIIFFFFYSEKAEPTAVKPKMEPIGKRKTQPQLKIPHKKNRNDLLTQSIILEGCEEPGCCQPGGWTSCSTEQVEFERKGLRKGDQRELQALN